MDKQEGQGPEAAPLDAATPARPMRRRHFWRALLMLTASLLLMWLFIAYAVMPMVWKFYIHRHSQLEDIPGITHTKAGIPGDPLNVALIGTRTELMKIMEAARWYPADPLKLRSSLKIAEASVFKQPYDAAPVSDLYLFDRKEDLAFEQPVGNTPRQRHHVRFWQMDKVAPDGRPVWVGSAVYDKRVGLSRKTMEITHVTAEDVDAERDYLFQDLKKTNDLSEEYIIENFHHVCEGRNGGGDPWRTDGDLYVGVIKPASP
jgi:hypothetical protein